MNFEYTYYNILECLQSVGAAKREQLKRFFSYEIQPNRVEHLLNEMAIDHLVNYDSETEIFRCIGYPKTEAALERRAIEAFWVIASMGSTAVREIGRMEYPASFLVIDRDDATYDITVIENEEQAYMAARSRVRRYIQGVPDNINHIAVAPKNYNAKQLADCGFDMLCTLDRETHVPEYLVFEN